MHNPKKQYRAYLLRCWREETTPAWRFSVEHVLTPEPRQGFEGWDALAAFLQAELNREEEGADSEDSKDFGF